MPGGRPKHRKNGHKATRHQTAQQKKLQAERSAATKAMTRERKEAAKKPMKRKRVPMSKLDGMVSSAAGPRNLV